MPASDVEDGALGLDAAADEHAAQEDDHGHDRGGHEQKHQLFTVQLDFMEAVVLNLCECSHCRILAPFSGEYKPHGDSAPVPNARQLLFDG